MTIGGVGGGAVLGRTFAALAACWLLGCNSTCGDCLPDPLGLVVTAGAPITMVTLSGPACSGGRFRCIPADFDSTIHDPCSEIQIDAKAEGLCVVDLVAGGQQLHVERQMSRRPPGCCGGYIGEANRHGYIDLTAIPDGGADGDADADGP